MSDRIENRETPAMEQGLRRHALAADFKVCALVPILLVLWIAVSVAAETRPTQSRQPTSQQIETVAAMPLVFEKNMGQVDKRVSYLSRMSDYTLFLTGTDSVLVHSGKSKDTASALRLRWLGASGTAIPEGDALLGGKSNYLIGNNPSGWHSNVPNFERVKEDSIYPGIDLVYYGNHRQLEYDLTVAPGADPGAIKLKIDGARKLRIDKASGDLIIWDRVGSELRFRKPVVYQADQDQKAKRFVPAGYALSARNIVSFELGEYDHTKALIIDPYVVYSTMFGGSTGGAFGPNNQYTGMAVDSSGYVYLGGTTTAVNLPTTTGAYQTSCNVSSGTQCANFFVAKFDPTQSGAASLVYATYIGGHSTQATAGVNSYTSLSNLAVDGSGDAYFTGWVSTGTLNSDDYPTTANAYSSYASACTISGNYCAENGSIGVVTKLDPTGSTLLYSTDFLINVMGGIVRPGMITVDGSQVAYIAGTAGPQLPTTDKSACSGYTTGLPFVAAFDTTKSGSASLVYSEYLPVGIYAIAADVSGNLYIGGTYAGPPTPSALYSNIQTITLNGFQTTTTSGEGAALVRLNHAGVNTYATYVGSVRLASQYGVYALSVDANGIAYVGGDASGLAQMNGFSSTSSFSSNGPFIAKIDTTQTGSASLLYSTFVAPDAGAYIYGVSSNAAGLVAFTGYGQTASNYTQVNPLTQPVTVPPFGNYSYAGVIDTTQSGNNALTFLSFLDGVAQAYGVVLQTGQVVGENQTTVPNGVTSPMAVGVGEQTNVLYVGGAAIYGMTTDPFLSVTGSYQTRAGNQNNPPFFYKISLAAPPELTVNPASLSFGNQFLNSASASQSVTVKNIGTANITMTSIVPSSSFSETDNCPGSLAGGASCQVNVVFQPTTLGAVSGTLTLTDSDSSSPQTVSLSGTGVQPLVTLLPASLTFSTPQGGTSAAQTLTLANNGTVSVSISSITIAGTGAAAFAQTNNCPSSLAVNSSCSIGVTFSPPVGGTSFSAQVTVKDSDSSSPQTADLSGTGTLPVAGGPLSITETIHVTDTETFMLGATLNIAENIRTTDTASLLKSSSLGVNEEIRITDAVATLTTQTITFPNPGNQSYGVAPLTLPLNASSGLPITYTATGPATVSGNRLTVTGVGTVTVRANQTGNSNWLPAPPVQNTFSVSRATLTVTANNASRAVGAANPVFTASYSGFVNGETSTVLSGAPAFSTTATSGSAAGLYPITATVGTLTAANYSFAFVGGTLSVVAAPSAQLVLTASVVKKAGGAFQATVTITNNGTGGASNVQLTTATLGAAAGSPLPSNLGTIAGGGASASAVITFPASAGTSGNAVVAKYSGTYTGGTFTSSMHVVLP